jgi:hypothetical protein
MHEALLPDSQKGLAKVRTTAFLRDFLERFQSTGDHSYTLRIHGQDLRKALASQVAAIPYKGAFGESTQDTVVPN